MTQKKSFSGLLEEPVTIDGKTVTENELIFTSDPNAGTLISQQKYKIFETFISCFIADDLL